MQIYKALNGGYIVYATDVSNVAMGYYIFANYKLLQEFLNENCK